MPGNRAESHGRACDLRGGIRPCRKRKRPRRSPPITPYNIITERRASAPHPGPRLKRDYFDALEIDVAGFAAQVGLDYERLSEMLAGHASIDVDTAVRISRAFQLSADAIMKMQVRADFAVARAVPAHDSVEILRPARTLEFPATGVLHGHLKQCTDTIGDRSYFFQQDLADRDGDDEHAGLHALFRGDLLRVYAPDGMVRWAGVVLNGLDGRLHLPYVSLSEWPRWFAERAVAELAFGDEHVAFYERLGRL